MDKLKTQRRSKRGQSTRVINQMTTLLGSEELDLMEIQVNLEGLIELHRQIDDLDNQIAVLMADDSVPEEDQDKETSEAFEYRKKFLAIKRKVESLVKSQASTPAVSECGSISEENRSRKMRLPEVELRKFSGDLKDWLGFWSQFEQIHKNEGIHGSDKFQYLLQSMEPGTVAYEIVSGYPHSAENYKKAVEALENRFGDKDLLLQVYVRELLKLVISNATAKEKIPFQTLYLKLDSHLRALKTLKLEKADPATWLFPLVESSLPKDVLLTWQRSPQSSQDGSKEDPPVTRVDLMMSFLRKEVEIQQKIQLAQTTFQESKTSVKDEDKSGAKNKQGGGFKVPTLAGFQVGDTQGGCVFCGKPHRSQDCYVAQRMSLEQKIEILKRKKLCFRCFKPRHHTKNCKFNVSCMVCGQKYYTIMCSQNGGSSRANRGGPSGNTQDNAKASREQTSTTTRSVTPTNQASGSGQGLQSQQGPPAMSKWSDEVENLSDNANHVCTSRIKLQTLYACIGVHRNKIRVFFDFGSQRSYVLTETAEATKLVVVSDEKAIHSMFAGMMTKVMEHKVYEVELTSMDESYQCKFLIRANKKISNPIPRISKRDDIYKELLEKNINLSDVGDGCPEIELLIGGDIGGRLLTGNVVQLSSGLTAVETKLGWVLSGERDCYFMETFLSMSICTLNIPDMWDLDTLGIKDPVEVKSKEETEEEAKQEFIKTLERESDGRYVSPLPWKAGHPELPSNYETALLRLEKCTTKLLENRKFGVYDRVFKDWLDEGIIEVVPSNGNPVKKEGHYLPHRPHFKDSLTTPVRPVFDASCKRGKAPSLNDCLEKGMNLIKKILELLMRFREKKIGISSDIRKAFQMITVKKEHRHYLKFLWWADYIKRVIVEYQHARVVFGATCSPFVLGAVLEFHLNHVPSQDQVIARKLLDSLYVDNSICSEDTVEEYWEFRQRSTEILERAKMELRMWLTNVDNLEDPTTVITSVLGMKWNRKEDVLYVNTDGITIPEKSTKRTLLSTVQRVFDPLGVLCPAIIPMKMVLQQVWINKLKWDEALPDKESKLLVEWCRQLSCLKEIKIPRLATAGITDKSKWSVHLFTDASAGAYACGIYLRVDTGDAVSVQLLAAKSRVTPVKRITIPRAELMGCVIGSRLLDSVRSSLKLENVPEIYWSDSTTALAWIRRDDQWGTFVGGRVREIRKLTVSENWRHVPGIMNPADLPSRGCSPQELLSSKWWEGPEWLKKAEESWPKSCDTVNEELVMVERKKTAAVVNNMTVLSEEDKGYTFTKTVRVMGWIRRFRRNAKKKNRYRRASGELTIHELRKAEIWVARCIQLDAFPDKKVDGLVVYEDKKKVLRVMTRLLQRKDLVDFKFPVLLPRKHALVTKMIMEAHQSYCHAGVNFLMAKLREKYWILQTRKAIKSVVSKCHRCRRYSSKPVVTEDAPLPLDRIKDARPFEVVGVDLAGPLVLKNMKKVWIVIYTCAVYRAVHLDLVSSCSTAAFIKSLKKFVQRHGRPDIIYSDNGSNFVGADNLFRGLDWEKIQKDEGVKPIQWKFNPPTAAWWGGFWERLIRVVKDLLRRTLGKACVTMSELSKMLEKVEEIMNGRPLTYVSEDPEDLQPLTPAMFLRPACVKLPEADMSESKRLQLRYEYMKALEGELKNRFRKEYLSGLICKPKKGTRALREGEVVFVGSDQKKRLEWKLGRILKLYPGKDGIGRKALVKTCDGILERPVQRLYPMEADYSDVAEKVKSWKRDETGRLVKASDIRKD